MQIMFVRMMNMRYKLEFWFNRVIPSPKKRGVVNMMVSGRTCAIRKRGMIHPRKTISSEAGP
jgi:hypothetical protein